MVLLHDYMVTEREENWQVELPTLLSIQCLIMTKMPENSQSGRDFPNATKEISMVDELGGPRGHVAGPNHPQNG